MPEPPLRRSKRAISFASKSALLTLPEPLRQFNAAPFDLRPDLGRIRAETLVITGRDDFICGPAAAQVLADGIPGAEVVIVEAAGHMLHLEQPAAYSAAVEAFLSR